MDLKPTKGLKVFVNTQREAIFGEESVGVQKVSLSDGNRMGVMTGMALAGFCEVEMANLDGRKHWFPIDDLKGEHGEKIVEEEIPLEPDGEEAGEEAEEEPA